jgi:prolyl 4-hydroxylase
LIYLNDIPEDYGGSTTFPNLNVTVRPVKNRGLFWRNLMDDKITGDERNLHAGNPLLTNQTEKWAINCWIRRNNDFM